MAIIAIQYADGRGCIVVYGSRHHEAFLEKVCLCTRNRKPQLEFTGRGMVASAPRQNNPKRIMIESPRSDSVQDLRIIHANTSFYKNRLVVFNHRVVTLTLQKLPTTSEGYCSFRVHWTGIQWNHNYHQSIPYLFTIHQASRDSGLLTNNWYSYIAIIRFWTG